MWVENYDCYYCCYYICSATSISSGSIRMECWENGQMRGTERTNVLYSTYICVYMYNICDEEENNFPEWMNEWWIRDRWHIYLFNELRWNGWTLICIDGWWLWLWWIWIGKPWYLVLCKIYSSFAIFIQR